MPHHELAIEEFQKAVRDSVKTRFDGKVWPAGLMEESVGGREKLRASYFQFFQ